MNTRQFEIGQRVNEYWCGNGTVTGFHNDDRGRRYYEIKWDSGLTNEAIKGYSASILKAIG